MAVPVDVKEEYKNNEEDEVDGDDVVEEGGDKEEDGDGKGEEMHGIELKLEQGRRMKIITLPCWYHIFLIICIFS